MGVIFVYGWIIVYFWIHIWTGLELCIHEHSLFRRTCLWDISGLAIIWSCIKGKCLAAEWAVDSEEWMATRVRTVLKLLEPDLIHKKKHWGRHSIYHPLEQSIGNSHSFPRHSRLEHTFRIHVSATLVCLIASVASSKQNQHSPPPTHFIQTHLLIQLYIN